jgi:hypothetical protein
MDPAALQNTGGSYFDKCVEFLLEQLQPKISSFSFFDTVEEINESPFPNTSIAISAR